MRVAPDRASRDYRSVAADVKQRGSARFVVATPHRSVCDDNARALEQHGALRLLALGTRRGTAGVPRARTRLNPWIGLCSYAAAKLLPGFYAESFRFGLLPWFDRWTLGQLEPGDHIISSYGYANACFKWVRAHGGKTLIDAGNSHIENFWEILTEEHRRWGCSYPPVARHWYERSRAMMDDVDFVLSPSSYVTNSFLTRGFRAEQILRNVYPIDLSLFTPPQSPRPRDRPLTIVNTGSLSLRKGTPYLLEAFRLILKAEPNARLLLTAQVSESVRPVLARYRDLPIDWAPSLPQAALAERLRSADIFVLPSLEEGLARTSLEALACGLPIVVTPHTGSNDLVEPGVNGAVVPIRDPQAIADAVLAWWERLAGSQSPPVRFDPQPLAFDTFAEAFLRQLRERGLIS